MHKNIGKVIINYTKSGDVENSQFISDMKVNIDKDSDDLLNRLNSVDSSTGTDQTHIQANRVFAEWFNLLNQIEYREKYSVESKVVDCELYTDTTQVKTCTIQFLYKENTI